MSSGRYSVVDDNTITFHSPPLGLWAGAVTYKRVSARTTGPKGKVAYTGTWRNDASLGPGFPGYRELVIDDRGNYQVTARYHATGRIETDGNAYVAYADSDGTVTRGTFMSFPNNDSTVVVQEIGKPPAGWTRVIE